jgi:hypothetical protein
VAVLGASVRAAAQQYVSGPAGCTETDLVTSLHFYQAPHHTQVVALEYRNTSDWTCMFVYFEQNDLDVLQGQGMVELQKGETVHRSFRWSTEDDGSSVRCRPFGQLQSVSPPLPNPFQFFYAPVLIPQFCSRVQATKFLPGPFVPDWKPDGTQEKPLPSAPVLTTSRETYYQYEPVELHVKLTDRPASDTSCPYLLVKQQDPQVSSQLFEEVSPEVGCHILESLPGQQPWTGPANEFLFRVPLNSGAYNEVGENTFTIYQVADPTPYGELRLVPSNSVTVRVLRTPRACTTDDLAPTLHFYRAPGDIGVVALEERNTSDKDCLLNPTHPSYAEVRRDPQKMVLHSGETTYRLFHGPADRHRFGSSPAFNGCMNPVDFGDFPPGPEITIFSPTLVPEACTALLSDYKPGPFVPDWKATGAEAKRLPKAPVLTAPKATYDENEIIELRLRLGKALKPQDNCPVLFENIHGPGEMRGGENWTTEIREIRLGGAVNTASGCEAYSPWTGKWWGPANEFPIEVEPNGSRGLDTPGARTVTVSELAGTGPDGELRLATSNAVTINVVDPTTIPRKWGDTEMGVRADLTVDKPSYALGEDIPLHLALENVSSGGTLYSTPFDQGPCFSDYTVNVVRADGSKPEFFQQREFVVFAESAPRVIGALRKPLEQGKMMPSEDTLFRLERLPRQQGEYRITVSWSAYKNAISGAVVSRPGAPRHRRRIRL